MARARVAGHRVRLTDGVLEAKLENFGTFQHHQVGDTLFSHEDGATCSRCGWGCFWARGGNFEHAVCERCGHRQEAR